MMLLKIRHGLLEIFNHPNNRKSAIIINDEIVLASGSILQPYIRPLDSDNGQCASSCILEKLQNDILINAQDNDLDEAKLLNSLNYQITFDRRSLVNRSQILTRYRAKILYLFSCAEVSKYIRQIFANGGEITPEECLLSSFVVLSFRKTNEKETFERFTAHIKNYLRFLYPIQKLDDVLTICTPFGLENFYKTINIGKISNLVSPNGCLFVLSNSLPMGCEGSAVFNDKLRLIGMIICTTFQRQNENVNMTLAANFSFLLTDFLQKVGIKVSSCALPKRVSNFAWERSIVVIMVNGSQGTGTLVKICNKSYILTCSHVVSKDSTEIFCRSVDESFNADVIWKNPNYNQPFDVALLKPRSTIPNKYFVKLSTSKPHTGQVVYNAGFPYFINFHLKQDFNPSIFQGRIIKCSPGAIMSDGCVQAGQSGGPMFDENGSVLGICVSNMKMDNVIYPNCNTAVPINDIRHTLEQYAKTEDVKILNNLVAVEAMQQVWNLNAPSVVQSKL